MEKRSEKEPTAGREDCYIRPKAAFGMLAEAKADKAVVYLHARLGYGKTRLVQEFLKGEDYLTLRAKEGRFCEFPEEERLEQADILVIEDLMWLTDAQDQAWLTELLDWGGRFILLLSRSRLPDWLMASHYRHHFLMIGEEALRFGKEELAAFLAARGLEPGEKELEEMLERVKGHPVAAQMLAAYLGEGMAWGEELVRRARRDFAGYLECELYSRWDPDLCTFVMRLSIVDTFTIRLAEMVSGRSDVERMLEKARQTGDFLSGEGENFRFHQTVLISMRLRLTKEYTKEQRNELYYNAGLYYEMNGPIEKALEMYETCGNYSRMSGILIQNAKTSVNSAHYYQLRRYYLAIPEEIAGHSVTLMAGLSMLYSLLLQPRESEKWYRKLKKYRNRQPQGSVRRREASSRIAYLDIALPHRGSRKLKEMLVSLYRLVCSKDVVLTEFSVTSNLPSLMNGGKDFCEWSLYDRTLAASIARPVSSVLGAYGVGFVETALGESQYEKGGRTEEVRELLNKGRYQAENGGKTEVVFAAVGLLVRLHTGLGDFAEAEALLADFGQRARQENAWNLFPNISALECRMALLRGDRGKAEEWMESAPREDVEFYILDRYRYLTKIRVYIWQEKWNAALSLIQRMLYYSKMYDRKYICMECRMLLAVCQYRQRDSQWKETFCALLRETAHYGFVPLITEEGAAVQKLLKACSAKEAQVPEEYYRKLRVGAASMAQYYPAYLQPSGQEAELSAQELKVLRLLCSGMTGKEIAAGLYISTATVRFHSRNIYRKLGVESKAEAVRIASEKKLV